MNKAAIKALAVGALAALMAAPAVAQSAADFYKGRTVTIMIGFSLGGTYGKTSTALGEALKPALGARNVIVQSRPGSGGLKMTNFAYNVAPKDGSVLLMLPDSLVITQLLRPKAAKYESDKFTFLGGVVRSNSLLALRGDSGVKHWSDAKRKEVAVGSSGIGSQTYQVPALINGLLGTKFKIVKGYKGSRPILLAMEQNEVQGMTVSWLSFKTNRQKWFESGYANGIVQMGPKPEPDIPTVPLLSDLVAPEDRPAVEFMSTLVTIGRSLAVPPGVPADRIAFLRASFAKAVAQQSFVDLMKKSKLEVTVSTGEEIQQVVASNLKISPAVVAKTRKMLFGK